jgi:hypothetical protein
MGSMETWSGGPRRPDARIHGENDPGSHTAEILWVEVVNRSLQLYSMRFGAGKSKNAMMIGKGAMMLTPLVVDVLASIMFIVVDPSRESYILCRSLRLLLPRLGLTFLLGFLLLILQLVQTLYIPPLDDQPDHAVLFHLREGLPVLYS